VEVHRPDSAGYMILSLGYRVVGFKGTGYLVFENMRYVVSRVPGT